MSVTLEDNKRTAIAVKLADMKATQNLLIANEKSLISACPDREITNRLEGFLRDDQKNLGIIDNVIVQYGIKAEPNSTMQVEIEEVGKMMQDSDLSLFDKVAKHELLKHTQAMAGVLVHKAGQVVGADIAVAIAPLNAVNFENRGHEEQLKGILESLSTLELTGKPSDSGLWSRVQDTIAALSGIAGSLITRNDHEVNICDVIRLDHAKVYSLFSQIAATDDPQKLEEFFGQVYQDLCAHSEAEEKVVYPIVRPYYNSVQKLYDEQAEMKQTLERIKAMNCNDTVTFKAAVALLSTAVNDHVLEEEKEMFPRIRSSFGDDQQKQLATDFQTAKSKIQDQRLVAASQ
ncbi:hemerythrin domain-containing protein [Pseudanabaena sp. FACHB-1998]|uniref:hemerythrin domain-containing protein n=1 Tax=Pseudanabaena sp. FACHB-1998 TaxID=2692858 RepID=UPI00167FF391|nr:hemerythrin domain-containing protein [Pseudanabaena sp. FACHB-1998]MBD2178630.1 hemerythrin domain-containing protein [Pseudanabaena sp. FACHB-1998]